MKRLFLLSLIAISFSCVGPNYWAATWNNRWALLLALLLVHISLEVGRKFSYVLTPALFFTCLSSLYVWGYYPNMYSALPMDELSDFKAISAMAISLFLILAFFFYSLPKNYEPVLKKSFAWISVLSSFLIFSRALAGYEPYVRAAPIGNASIVGCYLAVTYPFVLGQGLLNPGYMWWAKVWWGLRVFGPLLAIFLLGQSVPVGVLAVIFVAWAFKRYVYIQEKLPTLLELFGVLLLGSFIVGIGYGLLDSQNSAFFESSGRFAIYAKGFKFFWWHLNHWIGCGLNLTTAFLPELQRHYNPQNDDWWMWFHSDWFQVLFEMGYLGFFSYLLVFMGTLLKSWAISGDLFCAVLGYGAVAVFNYPVHQPLTAFLGGALIWMTFKKHETI